MSASRAHDDPRKSEIKEKIRKSQFYKPNEEKLLKLHVSMIENEYSIDSRDPNNKMLLPEFSKPESNKPQYSGMNTWT